MILKLIYAINEVYCLRHYIVKDLLLFQCLQKVYSNVYY